MNFVVYLWRIKEFWLVVCEVLLFIFKCLRLIRVENGVLILSEDIMYYVRIMIFVEVFGLVESEIGNRESL